MIFWPFKKQSAQARTPSPLPEPLPRKQDFESNDERLKVWLPESLVNRINWLSVRCDLSRQDVIRALVFRHLYGEVGWQAVRPVDEPAMPDVVAAARDRVRRRVTPAMFPQPDEGIRFSPARSTSDLEIKRSATREFHIDNRIIGPSDDGLSLQLPKKMKEDVRKLAEIERLTPSECVRKLLVLALLGAAVHADWQRALGPIGSDVYKLEAAE